MSNSILTRNKEWRETKARVEMLEDKIAFYSALRTEAILAGEDYAEYSRKISGYRLALDNAEIKLAEVTRKISSKYNLDAFAYDCPVFMEDDWYTHKLDRDGFILGIKF